MRCFVTRQRGADPAARDCAAQVRLLPLRSRARCKWLRSATWRRQCESDCSRFVILLHGAGFWLCDIPLRIGAAQFKFNHPPLLNGREILSSGRGAKILNLIAHATDGFAPRRRIAAYKFYLAARKFHGAYFALKFRRRSAADTERSINF